MIERVVVILYLVGCILIGILASRRVLSSRDEYWVAGRRIGTFVNSMAIMAALASGGSILGVMGYAYKKGIPATLALFAGAVVGFPLAAILVARPLRNFGRFTITDFMSHRYPGRVVRIGVPIVIVLAFTVYIVAQMKAAGIAAETLLGIPYDQAVTLATLIFVLYVSVGGMLAITWTDVIQGVLMVAVVVGTALFLMGRTGSPVSILEGATTISPALGAAADKPLSVDLGSFLIWATAVPVIPHIVMRVYSAKDAHGARMSLNVAMMVYSVVILAAVLIIVPVGKMLHPNLAGSDEIFLKVMQSEFSPLVRGLAVAAVLAAVMSTTDALLLACSSAVAHDLLGSYLDKKKVSEKAMGRINVAVVWVVGLAAMVLAYRPPQLITQHYTAAIGFLSAALFVPVLAGLWWKRANALAGMVAFVIGAAVYLVVHFWPDTPAYSEILYALPASAVAMFLCGRFGTPDSPAKISEIARLHEH